jgi:uncharacterized beta-barrel protein YwiB (DUF1934 family)
MKNERTEKQNSDKVFIKIKGNMSQGISETDVIEFCTEGIMEKMGEVVYLTYKESKISGLEDTTTTIKLDKEAMSLMRIGDVNYTMDFCKGLKKYNKYETNYGLLNMGIVTNDLKIIYEGNKLKDIVVDYDLDINGSSIGNNIININVN